MQLRDPCRAASIVLLFCLLILPAAAFDLRQTDIRILPTGDAEITLVYDENPAEYLGIKAFAASPSSAMEKVLGPALTRDGTPLAAKVDCAAAGTARVTVPGYADVQGGTYRTPEIRLDSDELAALRQQAGLTVDVVSDVTIVFPDGYSVERTSTAVIPAVTHKVDAKKTYDAPAEPASCKTKKDLPLSAVIPDEVAPVAAAGVGVAATAAGVSIFGSTLSMWIAKLLSFLQNTFGQVLQGRLADKEKASRQFTDTSQAGTFFGISVREVGVIAVGAVIIGVLFLFAARVPITAELLAIYIIMGGIALAVHEMAHWYLNRKYHATTEVQLWGLGTIIMALTAWLFGSVFAQPTLTLVYSEEPLDNRSLSFIMLSGPFLSLLIAFLCLCLIPLGGLWRTAGMIGFSINLLTAVFDMLPISPCDGRIVFSWNRLVWGVVAIPLLLLYFIVNL